MWLSRSGTCSNKGLTVQIPSVKVFINAGAPHEFLDKGIGGGWGKSNTNTGYVDGHGID